MKILGKAYALKVPETRFILTCGWICLCMDKTISPVWDSFPLHPIALSTQICKGKRVMPSEGFKGALHQFIKKSICKQR